MPLQKLHLIVPGQLLFPESKRKKTLQFRTRSSDDQGWGGVHTYFGCPEIPATKRKEELSSCSTSGNGGTSVVRDICS